MIPKEKWMGFCLGCSRGFFPKVRSVGVIKRWKITESSLLDQQFLPQITHTRWDELNHQNLMQILKKNFLFYVGGGISF